MSKPNFFIIGAPKTGTTSLHYYLMQHPEVFMCEDKEPHYFAKDLHEENDAFFKKQRYFRYRDESKYLDLFAEAKDEKIIGDASTTYIYSTAAAKQIHDFNPEAKILAIIREPVDLVFSWYNYLKFLNHEDIETFQEALAIENARRKNDALIPKSALYPTSLFYSKIADYNNNLKRYYDLFPKEQIKVILYDEYKKEQDATYKSVLNFLDIDPTFNPDYSSRNVSKKPRFSGVKKVVDDASFSLRQKFYAQRNNVVFRTLKTSYESIFTTPGKKHILEDIEREALKPLFKDMVAETGSLLNRDLLSNWDYK